MFVFEKAIESECANTFLWCTQMNNWSMHSNSYVYCFLLHNVYIMFYTGICICNCTWICIWISSGQTNPFARIMNKHALLSSPCHSNTSRQHFLHISTRWHLLDITRSRQQFVDLHVCINMFMQYSWHRRESVYKIRITSTILYHFKSTYFV